jgi:hypothetical protein
MCNVACGGAPSVNTISDVDYHNSPPDNLPMNVVGKDHLNCNIPQVKLHLISVTVRISFLAAMNK